MEVGKIEALVFNAKTRPALPGFSVGHHAITAGTFGKRSRLQDEIAGLAGVDVGEDVVVAEDQIVTLTWLRNPVPNVTSQPLSWDTDRLALACSDTRS
jgi:hypothetical protein